MRLREVFKDYSRFKSQASRLQSWILDEFEQDKQLRLFNSLVFPWMSLDNAMDLVEFG